MDEQEYLERLADSIEKAKPIQINIMPYRAYALCGLLQLALRNPALLIGTPGYEVAVSMIENIKQF